MPEKLKDIAEAIKRHRNLELSIEATNNAVGRAKVYFDGEEMLMWLTDKPNLGGAIIVRDINGNPIGTKAGGRTTIHEDGQPVYKNSKMGGHLIQNNIGEHTVDLNEGKEGQLIIFNKAFYKPTTADDLAIELNISLDGEKSLMFRNLRLILEDISRSEEKINELKQKRKDAVGEEEVQNLIKQIENAREERQKQILKSQSFIRKQAELRHQPILDPRQEEAKRSYIYSGTLVIDGGPGTGKTTSLIQRIKFLIDKEALDEYKPGLVSRHEQLADQSKSWVFYSPSELLSLYLKNNMVAEGLEATNDRVKVWDSELNLLIRQYKLTNVETQAPFLVLRGELNDNAFLFKTNYKKVKSLISGFDDFYLSHIKSRLEKIISLDISPFFWKNTGKSIQWYLAREKNNLRYESLIQWVVRLEETISKEVNTLGDEYLELINNAAAKKYLEIRVDDEIYRNIYSILEKWKNEKNQEEDEDELNIEEVENEEENFEESDHRAFFISRLKSLIRKFALRKYDKDVRYTSFEKQILEFVTNLESIKDIDKIGQLAFFRKNFERITKGIASNLLRDIPAIYKRFRKDQLRIDNGWYNIDLLKSIVAKDNNKRLHRDEQAFLIYFINNLIKKCSRLATRQSKNIRHSYFDGYRTFSRPVIGIDEATDFHIIDILAMHSLSDYEISSVTLSGDLMQRMTEKGLRQWQDLNSFIDKFHIKELHVSYRQSNTLLNLASEIYKEANKRESEYVSFMEKDDLEPKPLMCINEDENVLIDWIGRRINEIYNAYGREIPSIAIFLPGENGLETFASKLNELDILADVGIQVKACRDGEVLGSRNTVRVFSIKHIKGLEFEAVFFHQIDKLLETFSQEMITRYLYVGLSRATFYLGVTFNNELPLQLGYLTSHFGNENSSWKI